MSNAVFARGIQIKIGDGGAPENFVTIPEVMKFKGPSLTQDLLDVTNHDSPQGAKEFIGGLLDAGELSFDINFQPTNAVHKQVYNDLTNRVKRNFQLIYPGAIAQDTFTALIAKFDGTADEKDRLLTTITLRITGWPVLP
jgi:Lambda phage tail tube protein, TTP